MRISTALLLALAAVPVAGAQSGRTAPRAQTFTFTGAEDQDRAMLGISTSPGGKRDTLGLLITAVTPGSPAEKAGLEEGNRITSINGVNLKLSRDDAGDDDMQGVNQNRLSREMRKVKAGDDVSLEVWSGGRSRTVKVKTVSAEELNPTRRTVTQRDDDRAALGVFLSSTGSKRDTVGVFVQQVVEGGPADKAGLAEGDRIASINGVDVRVPREDAGDWNVASTRIDRLEREVRKLKAGQAADLVVVSGGRSRTVKVTAVKASDLPGWAGFSYRFGDGMMRLQGPGGGAAFMGPSGTTHMLPRIQIRRGMTDEDGADIRARIEKSLQGLEGLKGFRSFDESDGLPDLAPRIRADVMNELERELPRAMDELRTELPRAMDDLRDGIRSQIRIAPKLQVRSVNRVII